MGNNERLQASIASTDASVPPLSEERLVGSDSPLPLLPMNVIVDNILPYVKDRITYNHVCATCKEIRETARMPPWPQKATILLPGGKDAGRLAEGRISGRLPVHCLAMSADGSTFAYASFLSPKVMICDQRVGSKDSLSLVGHRGGVLALAFSPDGNYLASSGQDRSIILWPLKAGSTSDVTRFHQSFGRAHLSSISALSFSPDSRIIASGSLHNVIRLWDVRSCLSLATLRGHANTILSLSFSLVPETERLLLASSSMDSTVRVWDCTSLSNRLEEMDEYDGAEHLPTPSNVIGEQSPKIPACATFSPDGKWLVTTSTSKNIAVKRVSTLRAAAYLSGGDADVNANGSGKSSWAQCISFSMDSKQIISGDFYGKVRIWTIPDEASHELSTVPTISPSVIMDVHDARVASLVISPDNETVISGDIEGKIKISSNPLHQ